MKRKQKLTKQYGLVNKNVLINKNISIDAKGLYVYLCARSGSKYICNPTIATILKDLGICETTFHKLKKELITAGIIEVVKSGIGLNRRNNYNILVKSNKGYGIVYLDVLTNSKLDLKSKAIYGLLSSYAGASFIAYPFTKFICSILNICRNTYFKYAKTLKELNIIKTKQLHKNGRYSNCNYYINGAEPTNEYQNSKYIFINENNKKTTVKNNKGNNVIEYNKYETIVKDNIEYNSLNKLYEQDKKAKYYLENIVSILTNSIYFETKSKGIIVEGIEVSAEVLAMIYNKLNFSNIKTVVNSLITTNNKITNIRKYIKVALYNSYFQGKQNHYNFTR